ncbi:aldehyde dehydrogenase family protein [Ideonella sp.]|jgi:aldehyde dehydrogenase (NAD+)|uniref:aldehyde dehydrogenase family protein n=1 Tax=Ideonella sp. TaxID=1929293 RepID=UPI0037BF7C90
MSVPFPPNLQPAALDARASLLIGGQWREAAQTLTLLDPSSGQVLTPVARGGAAEIDAAVQAAQAALADERPEAWGRWSAAERGRVLQAIGRAVAEHASTLAHLEALDVGKPLQQGLADALALARYLEFYGGAADKISGETLPVARDLTAFTLREPHGVTGHIVPWNYPMQIIGRSVGAALAMGNACVLKPAEQACLTALAFAHLAQAAGLPPGALNVVTGLGEEAGAALTAHPGVAHLSFTGSVAVGRAVQRAAAEHTIPVTLELGGKSPQIVFADADLDAALPVLLQAGLQNAGQTCSASSRILVQAGVFDEVARRMAEGYRALRVGPALSRPDVGPLVSAEQQAAVLRCIEVAGPAHVLAQSPFPNDLPAGGFYVAPTLLAGLSPEHVLAQEEIFGPVQLLLPFEDEAEALRIANGTPYGLVAGVWTRDISRAMRLVHRLHCGQVFINNYGAGGGVELPFGGVKASGHGREKGFEALYGFSRTKTVALRHG